MKRNWHSIFLSGTIAGLELCWLWAILGLFARKSPEPLLWLSLGVFYPLGFIVKRFVSALRWKRPVLPASLLCAGLVLAAAKIHFFSGSSWWNPEWLGSVFSSLGGMFHSLNAPSIFLLSAAILCGCGWRLAFLRGEFATLIGEFQFGLALLLAAHFAHGQLGIHSSGLIPATLLFFVFGLSGISIAHSVERTGWVAGGQKGRWVAVLGLSIAGIIAAGLLISVAVGPSVIEFLLTVVSMVGELLMKALQIIFDFLNRFFSPPEPGSLPSSAKPGPKMAAEVPFVFLSESTREVMRFLWTVLVLSLILVALWRISSQIFEWLRRKMGEMEDAEVEPLSGAFREDVLNFLRRILLAVTGWPFRRRKKPAHLPAQVESTRRIYRQLLIWAAARGHTRSASQTPHEYLETLLPWLPENGKDLAFITEEYVRVRYSPSVPSDQVLDELRQSWRRLRRSRSGKSKRKSKEEETRNG